MRVRVRACACGMRDARACAAGGLTVPQTRLPQPGSCLSKDAGTVCSSCVDDVFALFAGKVRSGAV